MSTNLYKDNQKIIGSIIKLNRINKKMSQKELAKGICVPSYLSRIENGELLPSDDVITIIFNRLGLEFHDSPDFLENGTSLLKSFFNHLHFNEFDYTIDLFQKIQENKEKFLTSPLIIDYYLAQLARYCSTPDREEFESSKNILLSSFDLLSPKQKSKFNFYVGVDILNFSGDIKEGKEFIQKALEYKENGHCYFWLSFVYRVENNPIKAYDSIKKALDCYVADGNIISLMDSYEKTAEVYFMLDNYTDSIHYLEMALNIANKLKNRHFIEHLNSLLAWVYYKLEDFNKALDYLQRNTLIVDHRRVIPDSVTESLIYFTCKDKSKLNEAIININHPKSIEHLGTDLADILTKFFNYYIEEENYLNSGVYQELLMYIIEKSTKLVELKKVFRQLLKEFYIHNRKYKDALYL